MTVRNRNERGNSLLRRALRPTIAKKVGVLLLLFASSGAAALAALHWYLDRSERIRLISLPAQRVRDLARDLVAEARLAWLESPDVRQALLGSVGELERSLRGLERAVAGSGFRDEIAALRARWNEIHPHLAAVARGSVAPDARRLIGDSLQRLPDAAGRVADAGRAAGDELRGQTRALLVGLAVANGVFLIVGVWLTRRYLSRPVRLLEEGARRVQAGDFARPIPVVTRDELAGLARTFNRMAEDLARLLAVSDEKRREAEDHLRALVATGPFGLFSVDRGGVLSFAEGQAVRSAPLDLGPHVGEPLAAVHGGIPWLNEDLGTALAGEEHSGGGEFGGAWYEIRYAPIRAPDGELAGAVGVVLDATERRRLEEQIRHAHKLEAVGTLAAGVAHEFNNLLTVINGFSEILARRLPPGDALLRYVEQIHRAGERGASVTGRLLAFSRREVAEPSVLDANAILEDTRKMLRPLMGEDVEIAVDLDPAPGWVRIGAGQLQQVLLNLASNARDAMPRGGRFTLRTVAVTLDEVGARRRPGLAPGPHVILEASDTGVGMDAQTRRRAFEPFFTTKDEGTGLGLSAVYGIVTQNGGHLEVESEPDRGATFRIWLPRAAANPAAAVATPPASPRAGSETVLIVEDERDVRELLGELLRGEGYGVLEARDGGEALAVAARHPGTIDLLLCDVVMPRLSGGEVAEKLLAERPSMRVLFVSGYPGDIAARRGLAIPGRRVLAKPFTPETLVEAVRRELDAPRA